MSKTKLTAQQKRKAEWDKLVASLKVQQHTSIRTPQPAKQKPASGIMASI